MRHRKKGKKFHRTRSERKTFIRNLVANLIRTERMTTTDARAKAIRPFAERLVTIAKRQSLSARRLVLARIHTEDAAHKLFDEIAPRYAERRGGYLRITRLAKTRRRDGTRMARIEFI